MVRLLLVCSVSDQSTAVPRLWHQLVVRLLLVCSVSDPQLYHACDVNSWSVYYWCVLSLINPQLYHACDVNSWSVYYWCVLSLIHSCTTFVTSTHGPSTTGVFCLWSIYSCTTLVTSTRGPSTTGGFCLWSTAVPRLWHQLVVRLLLVCSVSDPQLYHACDINSWSVYYWCVLPLIHSCTTLVTSTRGPSTTGVFCLWSTAVPRLWRQLVVRLLLVCSVSDPQLYHACDINSWSVYYWCVLPLIHSCTTLVTSTRGPSTTGVFCLWSIHSCTTLVTSTRGPSTTGVFCLWSIHSCTTLVTSTRGPSTTGVFCLWSIHSCTTLVTSTRGPSTTGVFCLWSIHSCTTLVTSTRGPSTTGVFCLWSTAVPRLWRQPVVRLLLVCSVSDPQLYHACDINSWSVYYWCVLPLIHSCTTLVTSTRGPSTTGVFCLWSIHSCTTLVTSTRGPSTTGVFCLWSIHSCTTLVTSTRGPSTTGVFCLWSIHSCTTLVTSTRGPSTTGVFCLWSTAVPRLWRQLVVRLLLVCSVSDPQLYHACDVNSWSVYYWCVLSLIHSCTTLVTSTHGPSTTGVFCLWSTAVPRLWRQLVVRLLLVCSASDPQLYHACDVNSWSVYYWCVLSLIHSCTTFVTSTRGPSTTGVFCLWSTAVPRLWRQLVVRLLLVCSVSDQSTAVPRLWRQLVVRLLLVCSVSD